MRINIKSAQTAQSAGIARKTRVTKTRLVLVFNLTLSLITFDTLLKIFSIYAW